MILPQCGNVSSFFRKEYALTHSIRRIAMERTRVIRCLWFEKKKNRSCFPPKCDLPLIQVFVRNGVSYLDSLYEQIYKNVRKELERNGQWLILPSLVSPRNYRRGGGCVLFTCVHQTMQRFHGDDTKQLLVRTLHCTVVHSNGHTRILLDDASAVPCYCF